MSRIFQIGRLVIHVGFAKSLLWKVTEADKVRIFLASAHIIQQGENTVFCLVVFPVSLMFGWAGK